MHTYSIIYIYLRASPPAAGPSCPSQLNFQHCQQVVELARPREDCQTARSRDREEAASWCASCGCIGAVTVVVAVAWRAQLGHFRWRVPMIGCVLWKD